MNEQKIDAESQLEAFSQWAESLDMDLTQIGNTKTGDINFSDCNTDYAWEAWQAALTQPKAGDVVPDGWKLVPIEPTEKMVGAGIMAYQGKCEDSYAAMLDAAPQPPEQVRQDEVYGDILPAVGSRVFIRHGRDDDAHACIVTGYYAWADLGGNKALSRIFVRLRYEGSDVTNARLLCDCFKTAEDALADKAEAQQPTAPDGEAVAWVVKVTRAISGASWFCQTLSNQKELDEIKDMYADQKTWKVQIQPLYTKPQGEAIAIGEVRENGVTWFGANPHDEVAYQVGTKFYAIVKGSA